MPSLALTSPGRSPRESQDISYFWRGVGPWVQVAPRADRTQREKAPSPQPVRQIIEVYRELSIARRGSDTNETACRYISSRSWGAVVFSSALLPSSPTWTLNRNARPPDSRSGFLLGGWYPRDSPVDFDAVPLVSGIAVAGGISRPRLDFCKSPGQMVVCLWSWGNRTPPQACASYLVRGHLPWPGCVFGCPPVTWNGLHLPPFCRPIRPFAALVDGVVNAPRTGCDEGCSGGRCMIGRVELTGVRSVRFPRQRSHAPLQSRESLARSTISSSVSWFRTSGRDLSGRAPAEDAGYRTASIASHAAEVPSSMRSLSPIREACSVRVRSVSRWWMAVERCRGCRVQIPVPSCCCR